MARIEPWALTQPDKVALRMAETGEAVTFRELDSRATRNARWLVSLGLQAGDGIAMLMENHTAFMEMVFAARRAGVYFTPISIHLTAREVACVLEDCGAKVLIATAGVAELAAQLGEVIARRSMRCFMVDGTAPGFASWEQAVAPHVDGAALPVRPVGRDMLYSSGTTGKPKGIRRPLTPYEKRMDDPPAAVAIRRVFSFSQDMVYLSPAPLYHAAPIGYVTRVLESGGSVVLMKKFDPLRALQYAQPVGADHVHPHAGPAGCRSQAPRSFQHALRHSRRGAVPAGRQVPHDRMVGPGDLRVLLRVGKCRHHGHRQRRVAGASGIGGAGGLWHRAHTR
jgi:long-chain acyl-CoA synthetase